METESTGASSLCTRMLSGLGISILILSPVFIIFFENRRRLQCNCLWGVEELVSKVFLLVFFFISLLARATVGTSLYVWLRQWVTSCVFFATSNLCLKDQAYNCLIHLGGSSGAAGIQNMTLDGRRPSMEDDLRWKTPFDGRRLSMEEDLRWKTTFDGRRPSMEDDLRW